MSAVVKSKGGVSRKVGVMECFCSAGPSLIMFLTDFKSTGIKQKKKKEKAFFFNCGSVGDVFFHLTSLRLNCKRGDGRDG